ncbi:hypothetical protein GOODEAATRI_007303, partial [Goodea atripinnis]
IRLYARPDAISSGAGDYALHITKRLLGFYEDYFRVQYSLPKLGKAADVFLSFPRVGWGCFGLCVQVLFSSFRCSLTICG